MSRRHEIADVLLDVLMVVGVAILLMVWVGEPKGTSHTFAFDVFRLTGLIEASLVAGVSLAVVRQNYAIWKAEVGIRRALPLHIWSVALGVAVISVGYAGILAHTIGRDPRWYGFPPAIIGFSLILFALGVMYRRDRYRADVIRMHPEFPHAR